MPSGIKLPCEEGAVNSKRSDMPCVKNAAPWVMAATILGSSMEFIDGSVVSVALPVMQSSLKASVADMQWVAEAYTLLLASLMLVGGSMGDLFGRRRIFALGILIFTAASVWCGLAPDVKQLIIARAFQGIGGALLVPGSLAIISASFNDKERGKAIGTWAAFTSITAALGPLIGGFLIQRVSWRVIFFINVPFAILVLGVLFWKVPESSADNKNARLDITGALLATIGLGAAVFGAIRASSLGLSHPIVLGSLTLGVIALALFVYAESRSASPMMPLTLFHSRTFSGANLLTLLLYGALGGALFFFPFDLIQVQHYSPLAAGAAFLPLILILFFFSRAAGGLVSRFGAKLPLTIGPIIAAIGLGMFAIPSIGGSYWTTFFPAVVTLGIGMAISVAPLTTTVMSAVDSHQSGVASGINNAASQIASLLAIAVLGIFVLNTFNHQLEQRLAALHLTPDVQQAVNKQRIKLAAIEIPPTVDPQTSAKLKEAIALSFVASFRLVVLIAAGLAVISAVIAFLMIGNKTSLNQAQEDTQPKGKEGLSRTAG